VAIDRFFTPSVTIKNVTNNKIVRILSVSINPGQTVDLYKSMNVSVELFEFQIIKALEKPYGDLYVEQEIKGSIEILSLNLLSLLYSQVAPDNILAVNDPWVGAVPQYLTDETFEWASGLVASAPLVVGGDGVLSIPAADGSTDGYLSRDDWLRFNAFARGDIRIWQYQDFSAAVGSSVSLSSFENGTGLAFDAGYLIDDSAVATLVSDSSRPPTTTLAVPGSLLPGNRVVVTSHIGTTVVFNSAPDSSLNIRIYFLISLPGTISLPNDYQEDPEFLNDSSLSYLDDLYVNINSDESIYGQKTLEGDTTFNAGVNISVGATDGYVLTSDSGGNASWDNNSYGVNVGSDGYGVFKQRVGGNQLEFKNVAIGSDNLTIGEISDNITLDIDIDNLRVSLNGDELEPTGFPNRTDTTIAFENSSRTFSVTPTGSSFDIYASAQRYEFDSVQSITIPDEEGLWFFYFDENGVLSRVKDFSLNIITRWAYAGIIYWDATNSRAIYVGEERHGITMDGITHAYNHIVFGTQYISGLGLSNLTVDGSGDDEISAQIGISDGVIYDEDISLNIVDDAPQNLYYYLNAPIFYKDTADGYWRSKDADGYSLIYSGTAGYTGASGRSAFNEFAGGVWQLTEVTNNGFFFVHYFATNDIVNPIIGIQGISEYTNISDARNNAGVELASLSGLPFTEFAGIATVIYQTSNSYTNTPKARVRTTDTGADYVDWRDSPVSPTSISGSHSLLTGLSSDDHKQYALLSGDAVRNIITGKFDFSGGELGLPISSNPVTGYPGAIEGDIAYNSTGKYVVVYNGTSWEQLGSGGGDGYVNELNDLTDVDLVSVVPFVGAVLAFDGYTWGATEGLTMYNKEIDEVGSTIYIGEALPGTATSASSWRIKRIVFVKTGQDEDISTEWQSGVATFTAIWNNRLGYTYS